MEKFFKTFLKWIVHWLWIAFIFLIIWWVYALSSFSHVTPGDAFTASNWNSLVDTVNTLSSTWIDTYSTGETLTNKTWVNWKPIYRMVVDCWTFSWDHTCLTWISNVDLMWVDDFIEIAPTWVISSASASVYVSSTDKRMVYINNTNQIDFQWYTSLSHHFYVIVNYTKL